MVARTHPRELRLTATGALSCVLAEEVQSTQRSFKGERADRTSIMVGSSASGHFGLYVGWALKSVDQGWLDLCTVRVCGWHRVWYRASVYLVLAMQVRSMLGQGILNVQVNAFCTYGIFINVLR